MLSEKAYAICLLEILQEYSDAEHILPMREIIAKMQVIYGIKPDRRTIYAAAALLIGLFSDRKDNPSAVWEQSHTADAYQPPIQIGMRFP